jgi:ppGpp synthetase/RelA/SpoT-type nucleotidyltranferase
MMPPTGPESQESAFPPNITDLQIVQQNVNAFYTEKYGEENRYIGHNQRITALLDDNDLATDGLEMAVQLHDIVDHGLINPRDEKEKLDAQNFIYSIYEQVEDKDEFLYSIGCAISASSWEDKVGEGWRGNLSELLEGKTYGEQTQLKLAASPDEATKFPINVDLLKSANSYRLDSKSIREATLKYDVEGLLIKSLEIIDNLDNPPPHNPASTWRDCVEIVSCYSPALSLFGFSELASDLRGRALEYFYDSPELNDKARHQVKISDRYIDLIKDLVEESTLHEAAKSVIGVEADEKQVAQLLQIIKLSSRVKSEGSIRKKLASDKYSKENASLVPDGIGYKFTLPDSFSEDDVRTFAKAVKSILVPADQDDDEHSGILPFHISLESQLKAKGEDAEEDLMSGKERVSGYRSYHLAFVAEIEGHDVPFEIQILRESDERDNTYNWAAHDLFKTGTKPNEDIVRDLDHIRARAQLLRDKPWTQELNPRTWFDLLQLLPELDTPFHNNYRLVETDRARIMVPKNLETFAKYSLNYHGLEGDIILPPNSMDEQTFLHLIKLIDPALDGDEQIRKALDTLKSLKLKPRRTGESQLEGHLMPAAFHAGIMTAMTGAHWDANTDSKQYLSDTITAALLHDTVEEKDLSHEFIEANFEPDVAFIVRAMTKDDDIEIEGDRREAYAEQLSDSTRVMKIKISDRMQNHITDLVRLANDNPSEYELGKIKDYFIKTQKYLSDYIDKHLLPAEYHEVHHAIMIMGNGLFETFGD